MEVEKLQNKLIRALTKAGLSWASYSSIVEICDEINGEPFPEGGLAVWVYDLQTKQEKVLIPSRTIENFDANELVFIIKHELLHKAMYRNVKETSNIMLLNAALDACINKILFLGNHTGMVNLCKKLYSKERISATALCNPSITSQERTLLPENLRKLFDPIYYSENGRKTVADDVSNKYINNNIPDPMALYNSLSNILSNEQKEELIHSTCGNNASEKSDTENQDPQEGPKEPGQEEQEEDKQSESSGQEESQEEAGNEPEKGENEEDGTENTSGTENSENSDENPQDYNDENEGNEELDSQEEKDKGLDEKETNNPAKRYEIRGGNKKSRNNNKETVKQEKEFIDVIKHSAYSNYSLHRDLNAIFEKYIVNPDKANTEGLKDFIDSFETMKQVEGAEVSIYSEIASSVRFDPYPNNLTRTGIEFVALGVSGPDEVPLYLNDSDKKTCKKNICVYVDTSPSMREAMPFVFHIIEFFEELEECEYVGGQSQGKYIFSEKVTGCNEEQWEELKKGSFYGGWGTSFEAVGQHILANLNQEQVDICMIMTDGESQMNENTIQKLNETGIKVYRMYFADRRWCRDGVVESNLDKLTGSSFTIPYSGGK